MDLLLYLIKREEVDIYEVELGKVCDQYLGYLDAMQEMNLEVAGEFLVVAATLIYIKSRQLLPVEQQMPEEEEDEDDPRWELIRQLVEYKKFKEAANNLGVRAEGQAKVFKRDLDPTFKQKAAPGIRKIDIMELIGAFQKILDRARERDEFREVFEDKFTVGDKIQSIQSLIKLKNGVSFQSLFTDMATRGEIVVTFLAVLELIRLKQIRVVQDSVFSDMVLEKAPEQNVIEDHATLLGT